MNTIRIIFTVMLMMVSLAGFAQANKQTDEEKLAEYQNRVCHTLHLDYSMPDYSTRIIDAKIMGARLAAILNKIIENRGQQTTLATLSVIQTRQIEGLSYGSIKDFNLDKVSKQGNELSVSFITAIERNNINLKSHRLCSILLTGSLKMWQQMTSLRIYAGTYKNRIYRIDI